MRIVMEKDKNHQTERIYKSGYKLSEISNQLKVSEIKSLFEVKNAVREAEKVVGNWKEFRDNLKQKGFSIRIQYDGEFKPAQKNEIQEVWINKVDNHHQKSGFFFKKNVGFSLSEIDFGFDDLIKSITGNEEMKNNNKYEIDSKSETSESVLEIAGELLKDFLKPTYVANNDDELRKKKRKSR